jgi:hypothetical protein
LNEAINLALNPENVKEFIGIKVNKGIRLTALPKYDMKAFPLLPERGFNCDTL